MWLVALLATLVAAGLIGAILSTVDSMLNSAATIITFDVYKKYLNPKADERKLVWVGRVWIAIFIVVLALNLMGDGLRDALDPRVARSTG